MNHSGSETKASANTEAVDIERPKLAVGISLVAGKQEKQDDAIDVSLVEVMNGNLVGGTSEDIHVQGWGKARAGHWACGHWVCGYTDIEKEGVG